MRYDSWIATSSQGKKVEFAYKELSDGFAAISAKTDETSVMVFERRIPAPLTRAQVQKIFEVEHPAPPEESFDFEAERAKVSAMTMAELVEHCKVCAFAVKARPVCDAEWANWFRLGLAKEEYRRREWDSKSG
jgi:hypothetical protein